MVITSFYTCKHQLIKMNLNAQFGVCSTKTQPAQFIRIQTACIKPVKQYVRQDGGYIVMDNGDSVNLARDRKDEFLKVYQTPR